MFDIIRYSNPSMEAGQFGFEKIFFFSEVKSRISECEEVVSSAQLKNKETLILLRDYAFDEGAIKLIAEKKKACFLIDLGRVIRTRGVPRAILMSKLRIFLKMCNRYGAFYTFASLANNEKEMRRADELIHIAMLLDINRGQANFALKMLKHYL